MIYTTGTVNTVSGSAIVKGTGTKFKNNNPAINIGMTILIKSGNTNIPYMIKSVNSDTELVLAQPALATVTNTAFSIHITEPDNNSDAARTMVAINSYVEYFLDAMNTWMTQTGQTKIEMPNGEIVTLDSIKKMQRDIESKLSPGNFGVGAKANTMVNPPQIFTKNADNIDYSGFAFPDGQGSENYANYYGPLLSMTRFGGSDSTGVINQFQVKTSTNVANFTFRYRGNMQWSKWFEATTLGSTYNLVDDRVLTFRNKNSNKASYIESQFDGGAVRWRIGSTGNTARVVLSSATMSLGIEQINAKSSKGVYIDGNIIMDTNGNYENRFYGLGSEPAIDHTMLFMRNSDKMFGINIRNQETNTTSTVFRVDGKNKVAKVNEVQVMVHGDYGFAGSGMSENLTEAQLTDKFMGHSPSQIFRTSNSTNRYAYIYSPIYYATAGDTWWSASCSYTNGVVTFASCNKNKSNKVNFNTLWGSTNTTIDSNGFIKKASPIIDINPDGSFTTNDESEGVTVTRVSEGKYLIEGVLGFNADADWGGVDGGIEIPLDVNKQPLIWIDSKINADGSIYIKTYHRTHLNGPHFAKNNINGYNDGDPIDIPKGRFISVRVQMPEESKYNIRINEMSDNI